ncbi:MAG: fatty acid desaturase [Gammaproteobacteria bacterium]
MFGFIQLPWWGYIVVTLVLTQITLLGVTIFLHRHQAHRSVELHPLVSHFFRLWLWMTTGQVTKEWAAIHRKHHAKVETIDDPHSPQVHGLKKVLLEGAELYRKEKCNPDTLERYGHGTPDDWLERNVYSKHSAAGTIALLIINMVLFGFIGITIWAVQMSWVPFFAGGVINGVGHSIGYRNFETKDASRNIIPFGIFIAGEELHNNHHTYGTSAKFSVKWWEVDVGWCVIRLLQLFGLAKPKHLPPRATLLPGKSNVDIDTLKAIITNRFQVMSDYRKTVITPVFNEERKKQGQSLSSQARTLLISDISLLDDKKQQVLTTVLEQHQALKKVYQLRVGLQNIWAKSTATQQTLLEQLHAWCKQAEESGIEALSDFIIYLKSYIPTS